MFCTECRKIVDFYITNETVEREIKGKFYAFISNVAKCKECNAYVFVDEVNDYDEERFDEFYRQSEGIITINEIKKIMKKYNIEKRPLSKMLGMGDLTITRYLEGQYPSKKYSDMLIEILYNENFMKEKLIEGKKNITEIAYQKVYKELERLSNLLSKKNRIDACAQYIISSGYEITNLSLQKILYFLDGCSYAFRGREMYNDTCQAWVHGPVYPEIYERYKEFGYMPIELEVDKKSIDEYLTKEEIAFIDEVLEVYGIYNGKYLEYLSHKETPWLEARCGYMENEVCQEVISKESIQSYFCKIKNEYDIESVKEMRRYIEKIMLN